MAETTIGFSPIHGIGLFATRSFDEGEEVIKISGTILDERAYGDWIFHFDPEKPFGMHWVQISPHAYLDPRDFGKYINHSCNPNTGVRGRQTFVARRPIRRGEEVTFDYAMTDLDYFSFPCHCAEPACRRVIMGYRHLPQHKRIEYKDFTSNYIMQLLSLQRLHV